MQVDTSACQGRIMILIGGDVGIGNGSEVTGVARIIGMVGVRAGVAAGVGRSTRVNTPRVVGIAVLLSPEGREPVGIVIVVEVEILVVRDSLITRGGAGHTDHRSRIGHRVVSGVHIARIRQLSVNLIGARRADVHIVNHQGSGFTRSQGAGIKGGGVRAWHWTGYRGGQRRGIAGGEGLSLTTIVHNHDTNLALRVRTHLADRMHIRGDTQILVVRRQNLHSIVLGFTTHSIDTARTIGGRKVAGGADHTHTCQAHSSSRRNVYATDRDSIGTAGNVVDSRRGIDQLIGIVEVTVSIEINIHPLVHGSTGRSGEGVRNGNRIGLAHHNLARSHSARIVRIETIASRSVVRIRRTRTVVDAGEGDIGNIGTVSQRE